MRSELSDFLPPIDILNSLLSSAVIPHRFYDRLNGREADKFCDVIFSVSYFLFRHAAKLYHNPQRHPTGISAPVVFYVSDNL